MFMAPLVVMISWVYTYPQTHQVVYVKYVQLCTCQSYLNKVLLKNHTMKVTAFCIMHNQGTNNKKIRDQIVSSQ